MNKTKNKPAEARCAPIGDTEAGAMRDTVLLVDGYTKSYGGQTVVGPLSLRVEAGTIYGFIGPNGAGKTTLIRSIVGATAATAGSISICGIDNAENPIACKRMTAYVPDNPDVYGFLTGAQYLTFIADIFEVDATVRARRIERYARLFGIEQRLGELVSSYSHGMRQKLVLTGALLHDPRLLVLDEPFVGLDPQAAYRLKGVMKELVSRGAAIFFSSHVLEVVEKLCDEVAIIENGRIVKSGRTDDVCGSEGLERVFLDVAGAREEKAAADRAGR